MGRKKKEFIISEDDLCYEEPIEEIGFEDYVPTIDENTVACFNFSKDDDAKESFYKRNEIVTDHICNTYPLAPTPAVNGEMYDTKRTYNLRKSTVQKLNIIKANCPECNLYINTIVDDAINFYFDHLQNK